jgi:hypothetical protein
VPALKGAAARDASFVLSAVSRRRSTIAGIVARVATPRTHPRAEPLQAVERFTIRSEGLHRIDDAHTVHAVRIVGPQELGERDERGAAHVDLGLDVAHRVDLDMMLLIEEVLVHIACAKEQRLSPQGLEHGW